MIYSYWISLHPLNDIIVSYISPIPSRVFLWLGTSRSFVIRFPSSSPWFDNSIVLRDNRIFPSSSPWFDNSIVLRDNRIFQPILSSFHYVWEQWCHCLLPLHNSFDSTGQGCHMIPSIVLNNNRMSKNNLQLNNGSKYRHGFFSCNMIPSIVVDDVIGSSEEPIVKYLCQNSGGNYRCIVYPPQRINLSTHH
jgi:hypothetical protein